MEIGKSGRMTSSSQKIIKKNIGLEQNQREGDLGKHKNIAV